MIYLLKATFIYIHYFLRYFQCQAKYGLFAPTGKVSRSPAPDRRPSCQLHHSIVKRSTSRESLSSMTSKASTVASTASRVRLGVNSLKVCMSMV